MSFVVNGPLAARSLDGWAEQGHGAARSCPAPTAAAQPHRSAASFTLRWAGRPGALLHLDIKKRGSIGRVGHRNYGNSWSRVRGAGWECVHAAFDAHSRLPFYRALPSRRSVGDGENASGAQCAGQLSCA